MNKVYTLILVVLTLAAAFAVFLPMRLLRPFEPQTESQVALAYELGRSTPIATAVAFLAGIVLVGLLFRGKASGWLKVPAVILALALGGVAYGARVNFFEKMFAPIDEAGFVSVAEAGHLVPEEMVMGVVAGARAKAYPVGMMTYHHILNDEVGGEPIVVTY